MIGQSIRVIHDVTSGVCNYVSYSLDLFDNIYKEEWASSFCFVKSKPDK